MKKVLVLMLFAFLSALVYAQQKVPQHIRNPPSVEISGIRLRLGMTEADVAKAYAGASIKKEADELWTIGQSGTLGFKNGRLVFAGRSWINSGDDQIDALFHVVSSLNREGYTACKVTSEFVSAPTTDADTGRILASTEGEKVWLDCGGKSVLIVKVKIGNLLHQDVIEQLGSF